MKKDNHHRKTCLVARLLPVLVLAAALLLVGCNGRRPPAGDPPPAAEQPPANQAPTPQQPPQKPDDTPLVEATVYFSDQQAMYLVPVTRRVPANTPAQGIIEALIAGPQPDEAGVAVVPAGTRLLGMTIKDGVAVVDFSREFRDNFRGGSAGEIMLIGSIVNSLTELPQVEAVSFRVEGEPLVSLGHLDLADPVRRNPQILQP